MAAERVVGLTGGIATGKSVVAGFFNELGVPSVDADQIAREIVMPGSQTLGEIVEVFGDAFLLKDGSLDRKKLGDFVFSSPKHRNLLNSITHPRIAKRSQEKIAMLRKSNPAYVIYNAALLIENNLQNQFDALVIVSASRLRQIERIKSRDNLSENEIILRLDAQMPNEKKLSFADFIIDNDGDLQSTKEQTLKVHDNLVSRFAKDSAL
ncbi:MAG: dephospho-CoA kinase [Myxococcales bacterium]|nr:MAG: dephospho-CoA kinase [Myxococcales bacterium]